MSETKLEYRVWIYTRLWENGQEVVSQQVQLMQEAKHKGYQVVGMSMDEHGGRPHGRSGLKAALNSIRSGKADALLITRMGVLSHNDSILYGVLKTLQNHKAELLVTDYQLGYRLAHTWLEHKLRRRASLWNLSMPW